MYIIYIDESENSDRKDEFTPSIFGLSGLIITDRYCSTFTEKICELKKKYKIPQNIEIHGYDIFNKNKWCNLTDEERRSFCFEIVKLVTDRYALAKGFFIYKDSRLNKEDYLKCLEKILEKAASFVATHGGTTGKQLMVIFDEKDEFEFAINTSIVKSKKDLTKLIKSRHKKICRIIDHGFPGKSCMSEMLQVADFAGYVLRLSKTLQRVDTIFEKAKDPRFIKFVDELVDILTSKITIKKL